MGVPLMRAMIALLAVALLACAGEDPLAREEWPALVTIDDDGIAVRLLYEPEDGGPRERRLAAGERIPWPEDAVVEPDSFHRPATVLCAGWDQEWNDLLRRVPKDKRSSVPRLYLSAKGRDGQTRTMPFTVMREIAEAEFARLGMALDYQDLYRGLQPEGVMTLRITRRGDRVRYRWEQGPPFKRPIRWSGGDLTLTDAAVRSAGAGPRIPGLSKYMERRFHLSGYEGLVVVLETTGEVLAIDVLRAVECARGDPEVMFFPYPFPWFESSLLYRRIEPPRPSTTEGLEPKIPLGDLDADDRHFIVHQGPDGEVGRFTRETPARMDQRLDEYLARSRRPENTILLRIDRRTPWSHCGKWVRRAVRSGRLVRLRFTLGDYRLDPEGTLVLPRFLRVARRERILLGDVRSGSESVRGRHVILVCPESATCSEVWNAALQLANAGARSIDFE